MRALFPLLLPLFLASACVMSRSERDTDGPEGARSAEKALLNGLALVGGYSQVQPQAALDDLKAQRSRAEGRDLEMIDALLPIVERVAGAKTAATADDYRTIAYIMDKLAASRPDEFDVQIAMATGLHNVEGTLRAASGAAPPVSGQAESSSIRRARALAGRFPNQARAQAHLGNVLTLAAVDPVLAMRSYVRCMQQDPAILACKTGLKGLAEDFQRPRCATVDKKKLGFHAAHEPKPGARPRGTRQIKAEGKTLHMETRPALTGGDVQEVQEIDNGAEGRALVFWLSPRGAGTFADLTAKLADSQGSLAVVVGGKVHETIRVLTAIDSGQIQLRAAGLDVKKICLIFESRALPPDLVRPVENLKL